MLASKQTTFEHTRSATIKYGRYGQLKWKHALDSGHKISFFVEFHTQSRTKRNMDTAVLVGKGKS